MFSAPPDAAKAIESLTPALSSFIWFCWAKKASLSAWFLKPVAPPPVKVWSAYWLINSSICDMFWPWSCRFTITSISMPLPKRPSNITASVFDWAITAKAALSSSPSNCALASSICSWYSSTVALRTCLVCSAILNPFLGSIISLILSWSSWVPSA